MPSNRYKNLTSKQQKFVEVYLRNGRNGADAYRRAYNTKCTPQIAAVEANKLFRHPKIAPILGKAEEKAVAAVQSAVDRYAVSRERNVAELARLAYANMADYTRVIGTQRVVDLSGVDRDQLAAVQEITVEDYKQGRGENARDVRRVLKLSDKQAAIERINKMFGWVIDRSEQGGPGEFDKLSDEALDRELAARLRSMGLSERTIRAVLKPANDEADAS